MHQTLQLPYALLALALPAALIAQGTAHAPTLRQGAQVRIWMSNGPIKKRVASVVAVYGDTLLLDAREPSEQLAVPFAEVLRLEVRTNSDLGSHADDGAMLGLAMGVVGGAVLAQRSKPGAVWNNPGGLAIVGGIEGGVLGALVGGIIGHSISRERWVRVPLPLRTGIAPRLGADRGLARFPP
ncbi:MAG: hypothetical protein M3068_10185 [Gemmatimonadota bacterium]|nr:hypothetical protein [Gemmatimonadota bacterium]